MILVVEDDESLVRSITRNLSARRHDVRWAGTVQEALTVLAEATPDLLLLDIELPDGSGWQVLRAMRSAGAINLPVVVLSAMRPNDKYVKELGCSSVLEKPFPMEALLRLVTLHVGQATN